jgi:hypothetical protein
VLVYASLVILITALLTVAGIAFARYRHRQRLLSHGDALSLMALAAFSGGPAPFDEALLTQLAQRFAIVAPQYSTRENAAIILAVLEVAGALNTAGGVISLTHRGLQMRLLLAKGEPTLGLAAAFQRKRRAFSLTQAA